MGLIIQTSVLIMVIAIITYSRLDLFLPKRALEQAITSFMSHSERAWMNNTAKAYYDRLTPGSKKSSKNTSPQQKNTGTAFISLRPLFEDNEERKDNTKTILKNLFVVLYAKQPFVTNEIKRGTYPNAEILFTDLVDAIVQAGTNTALESNNRQSIVTQDQFFRLNVGPLQSIFVNVVNGCSCGEETASTENSGSSDDDEAEPTSGITPRHYCALFSFANLELYKPLSVYLTAKEVLMALYNNPSIVDEIDKTRIEAHKAYKKDKSSEAKAALERFKAVPTAIDSKFLDYNVSTTTPNRKRSS